MQYSVTNTTFEGYIALDKGLTVIQQAVYYFAARRSF